MNKYNGYTNHATWNLQNWLTGNDEATYSRLVKNRKLLIKLGNNKLREAIEFGYYCGTDDIDFGVVNWNEIKEVIRTINQ